ncbi:Homoserine/homoserine lactone efflux protein [Hartmannibacter diazotrophicus]|uniref:Homoserine/homoserine lactone efflux protein n=1 Tax=Hartmannibacter diazotrophicus TaxID=1482074 RepID=A0A2C9D9G7_9HYPH|nr:LysE family translocator [Hartmannibacter diazotrophicus]SON56381.1 Homoserine/homoserine lactone efflux protein [Hartmannibacter diazotrophicus]
MTLDLYLGFLLVSTLVILVPGPNVTLIIAVAASHGVRAGLMTVLGTTLAQTVQVLMVALGLTWLVAAYGAAFEVIRWAGAVYLVWLGLKTWRDASRPMPSDARFGGATRRGFLIGLANPKSLAFLAAFFPQFISPLQPAGDQFALLAVSYLTLAALFDSGYAVVAGASRQLFSTERARRLIGRISGAVLMSGGLWLAALRRS